MSQQDNNGINCRPWSWVPSLYFAEGIPYIIVMVVSLTMYKRLGLSNTDAALYTSWLYLPWIIKPLWSPFVDMFKTKRWWILLTQMFIGASIGGVGLSITTDFFVGISLSLFWIMAFCSATHDIAADGYYMLALDSHHQSLFVGIRSTFYRISMIAGQGVLIFVAGVLEKKLGNIQMAWTLTMYIGAGLMIMLGLYHHMALSKPKTDSHRSSYSVQYNKNEGLLLTLLVMFGRTLKKFYQKKDFWVALSFILLFRLGEAQLCKISPLFMLDPVEKGGLGLSTEQLGLINGTAGICALTLGGLLGGWLVSRNGLKHWLWPMVCCMNLPNLVYVYLSITQTQSIAAVATCVCVEQFGYGFGFTAFMLYLIYHSMGKQKTSDYAICTGLMAAGMMIPGLWAGWLQEHIGYVNFFIWVMVCTLPGFLISRRLNINPDYGIKKEDNVANDEHNSTDIDK